MTLGGWKTVQYGIPKEEARLGTSPFGTSGGGYRTSIGPDRVRPGTTAPGGAMGTPLTSRPPSGAPMSGGSLR